MTTEMYGAPFGVQSYYKDQDQRLVNQSLARVHNANAAKLEQEVSSQAELQKQMAMLGGQGPETADGAPPTFEQLTEQARAQSQKLLQLGRGKEAMDLAKDAAQTLQSVQTAATSQATEKLQMLRGQAQLFEQTANLVAGINSPQDLLQAQNIWASRYPGQPLPQELRTYNPRAIESLRMMSAQGRDALRVMIQEEEAASKQSDRDSSAAFRKFREGYLNDVMDFRRKREERLAKEGNTRVSAPGPTEVEMAQTLLGQKFQNFKAGDKAVAAYDIAARAKPIWKNNKGVDMSSAMAQVIEEMTQSGELSIYEPEALIPGTTKSLGKMPFANKETRYKDVGRVATNPLPIDKTVDPKTLKEGHFYRTDKGVYQWKNGRPVPVSQPTAPAPLPNSFTDDLGEDEED